MECSPLSVGIWELEDDVAVAVAVTAAYTGTGTGQSIDDLVEEIES